MRCDPVEKLCRCVDLIVEVAVGELDQLVDKFGDPSRPLRQRHEAAADGIHMLAQATDLVVVRINRQDFHALLGSDVGNQRPSLARALHEDHARSIFSFKQPNYIAKFRVPGLLAPRVEEQILPLVQRPGLNDAEAVRGSTPLPGINGKHDGSIWWHRGRDENTEVFGSYVHPITSPGILLLKCFKPWQRY